jgi:hypothetical protein
MSSRTLGTSAKKKSAKKPATPPKPARRVPLRLGSVGKFVGVGRGMDVRFDECACGEAVVVLGDGVSVTMLSVTL